MFWPEGENRFFWNERNNIVYTSACIHIYIYMCYRNDDGHDTRIMCVGWKNEKSNPREMLNSRCPAPQRLPLDRGDYPQDTSR